MPMKKKTKEKNDIAVELGRRGGEKTRDKMGGSEYYRDLAKKKHEKELKIKNNKNLWV